MSESWMLENWMLTVEASMPRVDRDKTFVLGDSGSMVHAVQLSVVRQWGVIPTAAEVLVRGAGGAHRYLIMGE